MGDPLPVVFVTPWYPTEERTTNGIFIRDHASVVRESREVAVIHLAGLRDTGPMVETSAPATSDVTGGVPTVRATILNVPAGASLVLWRRAVIQALTVLDLGPAILHAHVFSAGAPAVLARRHAAGVVVTEHWSGVARGLKGRDRLRAEIAYRGADCVTAPSFFLRDRLPSHPDATVIPNPLAETWFNGHPARRPRTGNVVIAGIGNLNTEKRFDRLIDAFSIFAERDPRARLVIAGDGPLRQRLVAQANATIPNHVEFVGSVDRAAVRKILEASDVLAVSSDIETFSLITAEALAIGTPVLATACGGPTELITPVSGVVTAPSAAALARGLDQLLTGDVAWDPVAMRESVSHLHPDRVGEAWNDLYGRVTENRHKGPWWLRPPAKKSKTR